MMNQALDPASDIPRLRRYVEQLIAASEKAFLKPLQFDQGNQLAFMAASFAIKQIEHAQSVLTLDRRLDTVLITRSMFEGLSQLLWASQSPDDRPLRWRAFAFVRDWRTMRKQEELGLPITARDRAGIEDGLREHGDLFLTTKARKAKDKGQPLPDDPYTWNWYGEKEKEVFEAVGGELVYAELYGPFSEWHHWRIGGFGRLIKYDEQNNTFTMVNESPELTATAFASAFQCLWQTMSALEHIVPCGIRDELDTLYRNYVAGR